MSVVVISYKKLIHIFVKQAKQKRSAPSKRISPHCCAFSECGAGQSCSSVISLLLISHFKHKDNRFYYVSAFTTTVWTEALHCLMFPNVTYVFVSFFLCLMIPWLVTVTKNLCLHDLCSAKLLSKQIWISRVVEFLIQIFMHKPVDKNITFLIWIWWNVPLRYFFLFISPLL